MFEGERVSLLSVECVSASQSHTVELSRRNTRKITSKRFKCKATASGVGEKDDNSVDKK